MCTLLMYPVFNLQEFDFDVPDSLIPAVAYYTIRASVLLGSEIPIFKFPNADGAAKMKVMIDFGCQRLEFPFRANRRGQIEWLENAERKDIELPADMRQLPDVGIYLVRGPDSSAKTVSWARVPAARLLAESFSGAPYWQTLEPDHSRDKTRAKLGATNYPGALLLRLGLGLTSDASSFKWKDDRKVFADKRPYCLRVHVYQGRSIPAKDANGLIDPYVKVRYPWVHCTESYMHLVLPPPPSPPNTHTNNHDNSGSILRFEAEDARCERDDGPSLLPDVRVP